MLPLMESAAAGIRTVTAYESVIRLQLMLSSYVGGTPEEEDQLSLKQMVSYEARHTDGQLLSPVSIVQRNLLLSV